MAAHEFFAFILDGEIKNIMKCDDYPTANHLAKMVHGDDAFAEDITQYNVGIGDKYYNNCFWRIDETGEEILIKPNPTQEQEIERLKSENEELTLVLAELIGGVL